MHPKSTNVDLTIWSNQRLITKWFKPGIYFWTALIKNESWVSVEASWVVDQGIVENTTKHAEKVATTSWREKVEKQYDTKLNELQSRLTIWNKG